MPRATSKASIVPGRGRAGAADHRAHVEAVPVPLAPCPRRGRAGAAGTVPTSRPCRCRWRRAQVEAVPVPLAPCPRRGRAGGAGHRAHVEAGPVALTTVPRSRPGRWRWRRAHVEAGPVPLATVPTARPWVAHDSAPSPVSAVPQHRAVRTSTLANAGAESAEVRKVSIHAGLRPMASAVRSAGSAGSAVKQPRPASAGVRAAPPIPRPSSSGDAGRPNTARRLPHNSPPHRAG